MSTAATATAAASSQNSIYQQEVDVLRGQIKELDVSAIWTSADPPKAAGIYGVLLQGLQAGDSLINAFARLNDAAADTRNTNYNVLQLVLAYQTKLTTPRTNP